MSQVRFDLPTPEGDTFGFGEPARDDRASNVQFRPISEAHTVSVFAPA